MLTDFPKIECPFIRKTFPINIEDFKNHGSTLKLRTPEVARLHGQLKGVKLKSTMRETVIKSRNEERTHS